MFIFRYPGHSKFMQDIHKNAMQQVNDYIWAVTHNITEEDDDHMEQSKNSTSYTFDFPGVGPDRVSVKLSSDRKSISLFVDGTVQKVIIPPYIPGLKPEDLSVKMEHGRLVVSINKTSVATKEDEVSIPINGRQFLQE